MSRSTSVSDDPSVSRQRPGAAHFLLLYFLDTYHEYLKEKGLKDWDWESNWAFQLVFQSVLLAWAKEGLCVGFDLTLKTANTGGVAQWDHHSVVFDRTIRQCLDHQWITDLFSDPATDSMNYTLASGVDALLERDAPLFRFSCVRLTVESVAPLAGEALHRALVAQLRRVVLPLDEVTEAGRSHFWRVFESIREDAQELMNTQRRTFSHFQIDSPSYSEAFGSSQKGMAADKCPDALHMLLIRVAAEYQDVLDRWGCQDWEWNCSRTFFQLVFLALDTLRSQEGIDLGVCVRLGDPIDLQDESFRSPTLERACQQCVENGWMVAPDFDIPNYRPTPKGRALLASYGEEIRLVRSPMVAEEPLGARSETVTVTDEGLLLIFRKGFEDALGTFKHAGMLVKWLCRAGLKAFRSERPIAHYDLHKNYRLLARLPDPTWV